MATLAKNKITIRYIRNYILDNNVSEKDTLLLHSENFDDLVLEHRVTYGQGITVPFYFLSVLITEAPQGRATLDRIRIVRNDPARYEGDFDPKVRKDREFQELSDQDKKIYQCHHCANLVTSDGVKVGPEARAKQIAILQQFSDRLSSTWIDICRDCEDELMRKQ